MPTQLTRQHLQAICITSLILATEFFNFAIVLYLSELLLPVFFGNSQESWLAYGQLFVLLAAGYVLRPLAGLLIGCYGDHHGRRVILKPSLFALIATTVLMAILPTYANIGWLAAILFVVVRLAQSIAIAAIMPTVWVYITERLPTRNLGLGCGSVLAGCVLAMPCVIMLISWLDSTLSYEQMFSYGWRVALLCGAMASLLVLPLINQLQESPIFVGDKNQQPSTISTVRLSDLATNQYPDTLTIAKLPKTKRIGWAFDTICQVASWLFHQLIAKTMFISLIIASTLTAAIISLLIFTPTLLSSLIDLSFGISEALLWRANLVIAISMAMGAVVFGLLVDRFNAGVVLILGSLFLALQVVLLFNHLRTDGDNLLWYFASFGVASGIIGAMPSVIVRLFSRKIRLSSIAVILNFAIAIIAGFLPFALGLATVYLSFAPVIFISTLSLLVMFVSFYIYYLPRSDEDMWR